MQKFWISSVTREFKVQINRYDGDGLNLYQYCQANPVGYVDPSGHNICSTQLSLYKKYKEFFAKKMPEDEAKKKAYEYMRKKMGLTADNPFTEASEGGTKSAYNDRGNTVKNWKGHINLLQRKEIVRMPMDVLTQREENCFSYSGKICSIIVPIRSLISVLEEMTESR